MPTAKAVSTSQLPSLTMPQWLAFVAFLIVVAFAFFPNSTVEPGEFNDIRILAAFLIGALLPSDALIRFGRNLWAKSPAADVAKRGDKPVTLADAPRTTLPQVLAFAAFLVAAVLVLVSNTVVTKDEFDQVEELLRVLIVALLPSEAAIRFGRARNLSEVQDVTAQHLKRI
jgi:hypothetical protein